MFLLYKLAGSLVTPPGLLCALLLLIALISYIKSRKKTVSLLLMFFTAGLWFMSTPIGAYYITGNFENRYEVPEEIPSGETYVICLGGGTSYNNDGSTRQPSPFAMERVFASVKIANETGTPIIFSGGNVFGENDRSEAEILAQSAKDMGYEGKIILEDKSKTTKENMKFCAEIVKEGQNAIIVTNAFHMSRSMRNAEKYMKGRKLIPYPSGRMTDPVFRGSYQLLPSGYDFAHSCAGIREYVGIFMNK